MVAWGHHVFSNCRCTSLIACRVDVLTILDLSWTCWLPKVYFWWSKYSETEPDEHIIAEALSLPIWELVPLVKKGDPTCLFADERHDMGSLVSSCWGGWLWCSARNFVCEKPRPFPFSGKGVQDVDIHYFQRHKNHNSRFVLGGMG